MTLRREPHLRRYQLRTLQSLVRGLAMLRGATFTVVYPRQAGKNEVSAALVAFLLRANAWHGGSVVVCAPTLYPQASISLERTLATMRATEHLYPFPAIRRDNALQCGQARAVFLSASPAAHVAGHTASLALIGDEAQDIDADWFNRQFRPMAASTGASTVLFGTPWDGETLLETVAARNRRKDRDGRSPVPLHHEVHWREVAASLPRYGEYVRGERERLGASHPLFVTQYELRSIHAAGRLFRPEQLRRLEGAHLPLDGPRRGERYVAGLDFGGPGAGADATVLAIARTGGGGLEVVRLLAWQGAPYEAMLDGVAAALAAWDPAFVCGDATGLGGPLIEALARRVRCPVEPLVFHGGTKSSLGYGLVAALETGKLRLHADDGTAVYRECLAQLRECEGRHLAGGALRWGNERGNDDIVVALALCVRAAGMVGPARVASGRRPQ